MNRLCECLLPTDRETRGTPEIRLVCEEAPETLAIPAGPDGPETPDGFERPEGPEDLERPEDLEEPEDFERLERPEDLEGPEGPRGLEGLGAETFGDAKGDGAGGEGLGGDLADPPELGEDAALRVVVQRVGDSGVVGALREYSAAEWLALGRSRGGGSAALDDERVTFVAPGLVVRAAPACESVEIFAGEGPVACGDRAILKITLSGTARDRATGALTVRDVRASFYAMPRVARDSWTSSEVFRPHIAEALRLLRVYLGADVRLSAIAPASPGVSPRR